MKPVASDRGVCSSDSGAPLFALTWWTVIGTDGTDARGFSRPRAWSNVSLSHYDTTAYQLKKINIHIYILES